MLTLTKAHTRPNNRQMPGVGSDRPKRTELTRFASAQRPRAGICRHIQSITLFITFVITDLTF